MPADRENEIGRARCPVCPSIRANLRLSARGLAYLSCNSCNAQVFARSETSDEMLRRRIVMPEKQAPEPVSVAPAAAPMPVPIQKKAAPAGGLGWGVLA